MVREMMFRVLTAMLLRSCPLNDEDERGQTLVEYALIVALISIAIAASLAALRTGIGDIFSRTVAQF
jgi:Flp pilus assembly pilin Flp